MSNPSKRADWTARRAWPAGPARLARARYAQASAVVLLAVAATVQAVAQALALGGQDGSSGAAVGYVLPLTLLALLATVPLGFYRPAMAAVAVTFGNAVALASFGPVTAGGVIAELAAACWLGLAASGSGVARRLRFPGDWRRVAPAARALGRLGRAGAGRHLAIGLALPFLLIALATKDSAAVLLASAVPAAAAAGIAVRARRLARTRTAAGEALADTLLAHTARGERARIARELHDVVAHHISMIAVLSEAGLLTTPGLPEAGARRFAEIGDTARAGLTEMRRLLGVLRDDALAVGEAGGTLPAEGAVARGRAAGQDTGPLPLAGLTDGGPGAAGTAGRATRQPQPGLRQLTELIDAARVASAAGTRLIISGPVAPLDPGVELAAYRIVQEALTNARRHAPGAPVDVELRYSPGALRLRVRDSGPGPAGAAGAAGAPAWHGHRAGAAGPADALSHDERSAESTRGDRSPAGSGLPGGGHGLSGMRERAFSAGGSLYAGLAPGGGFLVEAVLPADLESAGRRGAGR